MKKIFTLILLLMFSVASFSYINIHPIKFEKDINDEAYETFKLYNASKKKVRYRIYMEENSSENSMLQWCEVYPKSITLNPLQDGEIKFFVKAPEGTPVGRYKAKLVIKEVDVPSKEKTEKKKVMTMLKINLVGVVE